jgi:hypothetical protein
MNAKDTESFHDWFESLLNMRHWANQIDLLGILQLVLTSKPDFGTPKMIQHMLLCCVISNQLDWNLFQIVFLDSGFWRRYLAAKTFDLWAIFDRWRGISMLLLPFFFIFSSIWIVLREWVSAI